MPTHEIPNELVEQHETVYTRERAEGILEDLEEEKGEGGYSYVIESIGPPQSNRVIIRRYDETGYPEGKL